MSDPFRHLPAATRGRQASTPGSAQASGLPAPGLASQDYYDRMSVWELAQRMGYDRIVALCEEMRGGGAADPWQPVSTAPTDGAPVLVGRAGRTATVARYAPAVPGWFVNDPEGVGSLVRLAYAPTHWMPAPHPPPE